MKLFMQHIQRCIFYIFYIFAHLNVYFPSEISIIVCFLTCVINWEYKYAGTKTASGLVRGLRVRTTECLTRTLLPDIRLVSQWLRSDFQLIVFHWWLMVSQEKSPTVHPQHQWSLCDISTSISSKLQSPEPKQAAKGCFVFVCTSLQRDSQEAKMVWEQCVWFMWLRAHV